MTEHEFLHALEPWFERQRRAAWKPVTREGDGDLVASKLGGIPWLAEGEAWPTCPDCGQPMPLFLQLKLDALPDELAHPPGATLLQLFHCMNDDEGHGESNPEGNGGWLARFVAAGDDDDVDIDVPDEAGDVAPRTIVLWQRFDDYPDFDDFDDLGLLTEYVNGRPPKLRVKCPDLGLKYEGKAEKLFESLNRCREGDKLGGWPKWAVESCWPKCPECGERMQHVVQLDSQDHQQEMFADRGTAHLTQCPAHPAILAFGWSTAD